MTPLAQRIRALVSSEGPISIAEFMTLALHDREAGYYATRDPFGTGGDFITAPEISQMFGELIGLWLAQVWIDQGKRARPLLVELGPGRGTLMKDVLRALKRVPELRDALEVVLVEASAALRKVQEASLRDSGVPLRWADSLDATGADRPLLLVANEFFDALPIRQFVRTAQGWCERMVALDAGGALGFALAPLTLPESLIPADRRSAPAGGVYEKGLGAEALGEQIGHAIARQGGAALIIDYGYDRPGFGETLQAVAAHGFASVLANAGASDLSAHVDFAALAQAARGGGAASFGPAEQGAFLVALGIRQRTEALARAGAPDVQTQRDRLIAPEQMGTLFKALAILPPDAPAPPGF